MGASISERADTPGLKTAYGVFAAEAQAHDPDYQPQTVTTDGWTATHNAWTELFPGVHLILCFLHAILKIRDLSPVKASWTPVLQDKLWNVYHAISKQQFAQRLRRVLEWGNTVGLPDSVQKALERIRAKSHQFQVAFEFPGSY